MGSSSTVRPFETPEKEKSYPPPPIQSRKCQLVTVSGIRTPGTSPSTRPPSLPGRESTTNRNHLSPLTIPDPSEGTQGLPSRHLHELKGWSNTTQVHTLCAWIDGETSLSRPLSVRSLTPVCHRDPSRPGKQKHRRCESDFPSVRKCRRFLDPDLGPCVRCAEGRVQILPFHLSPPSALSQWGREGKVGPSPFPHEGMGAKQLTCQLKSLQRATWSSLCRSFFGTIGSRPRGLRARGGSPNTPSQVRAREERSLVGPTQVSRERGQVSETTQTRSRSVSSGLRVEGLGYSKRCRVRRPG